GGQRVIAVGGSVVLDDDRSLVNLDGGRARDRLVVAEGPVAELIDRGHRRGPARVGGAAARDGSRAAPDGRGVVAPAYAALVVDVEGEDAVLHVVGVERVRPVAGRRDDEAPRDEREGRARLALAVLLERQV